MSDRGALAIPPDTVLRQAEAADPGASAWVSANAGSGKTFVLTRRVLRLLLAGAAPGAILCLTYTKAAAAEMRARVGAELGAWARMDDDRLRVELEKVTGSAPVASDLGRARTLFAHALETPGGLKILTIHAFCEAVLQRFPREAGVPVDFTVIEEEAREGALRAAREAVLAEGLSGHPEVAEAVGYLFAHTSDSQIESGIAAALAGGRTLNAVLADPEAARARLAAFLGVAPGEDEDTLLAEALDRTHVPFTDYPRLFALCPPGDGTRTLEDKLARIDPAAPTLDQLFSAYLTGKHQLPANPVKAAIRKADAELADRLEAETHRLFGLCERRKTLRLFQRSRALLDLMVGIALRYEGEKRARSWLDFDDLIARTGALFADAALGDWVRYKLDAAIEHILVDEGQDTNGQQWEVVGALTAEFFAGEGAAKKPRTLFGVGDPKQSIYSFQGAEPELFIAMGTDYRGRVEGAGARFLAPGLRTSFRTLAEILEGVDKACARPDIAQALFEDRGPRHESARKDRGGTITLWAPYPEPEAPEPAAPWPTEPAMASASAARRLAERIAGQIAEWMQTGAPLAQRGRAIVPDDILILVQARKALFAEIVRALKRFGVPSPGADRVPVTGHIAVRDLLGLADILLNPADDLLLAAILRSPLYGLSEADLYDLAADRPRGQTLWAALEAARAPAARAALEELKALRARVELDRPYALFAHVLYGLGGLRRFHARLGAEVDDVFAELLDLALDHENADQPGLVGFLARMRASDVTIKRDLAETGGGVRVMTVHGAKGLEAPIVILADATDTPRAFQRPVFFAPAPGGPVMLFPLRKDDLPKAFASLHDEAKADLDAEYWRKFYVAMTRAEDALILAGTVSDRKTGKGSWHEAVAQALAPPEGGADAPEPGAPVFVYPPDALAPLPAASDPAGAVHPLVPLVLDAIPAAPTREIVSPSALGGELASGAALARAGEALLDAETARRRGIALHALLQHLGTLPADRRPEIAALAAGTLLPGDAALAQVTADEALALLADPALSRVFGRDDSRAEVGFALEGTRAGAPIRLVGRIDRLVIEEGRVLVVDFKSDAKPPPTPEDTPPAYCAQLALYRAAASRLFPELPVDAAILWTACGRLDILPSDRLDPHAAPFALG